MLFLGQTVHIAAPAMLLSSTTIEALLTADPRFPSRQRVTQWVIGRRHAKSAGNAHVISDKRPLGVMQIVPAIYAELRAPDYRRCEHTFYPRDNILAGTTDAREARDCFGSPGFLAAYHAGLAPNDDYLTCSRRRPKGRATNSSISSRASVLNGRNSHRSTLRGRNKGFCSSSSSGM
jgi:hypothetical protein